MSTLTRSVIWSGLMIAGIAMMASGLRSLKSDSKLATDRNPMALQKSAYGRMLARLSESTIDRVWHLGVEQIVPHTISGDEHGDHDRDQGNHDHSQFTDGEDLAALPQKSTMDQLKGWYNNMRVVKYSRTNPYSLSERHLATVSRELEEMMLRSYKMDPGHYGVYNSYHLFLTTHKYGGTPAKRKHAFKVAEATFAEVNKETEDPEPWLTAASAAFNMYQLETEQLIQDGEPIPKNILYHYRDMIAYCLDNFDRLQAEAEENGTWQNLSFERQFEIGSRARFTKRTWEPFEVMIARAEHRASPLGRMEADVSEMLDSIMD